MYYRCRCCCTINCYGGITLHETSIKVRYAANHEITFIVYLSFTAAIYITISVAITALALNANGTTVDRHLRVATNARFLTTTIDTLSNGGCAVDGESNVTADCSEVLERHLSVYIVLPVTIGV